MTTAHCFHDTVRRVKKTATNDLPGYVVVVEKDINDWIQFEVDDVLTGIMLLLKFKDINGDEVQ